jgi:pentatricopeptide repeat protein
MAHTSCKANSSIKERVQGFFSHLSERNFPPLPRLQQAAETWKALCETGAVTTFGPHDISTISRLLTPTVMELDIMPSGEIVGFLQEVAIHLAVRGAPDVFVAVLVLFVRQRKVQAADQAFARFHSAWTKHLEDDIAHPVSDSQSCDGNDLFTHLHSDLPTEPRRISDMIAAVIAAHAKESDFSGSLTSALGYGYNLLTNSSTAFLPTLGLSPGDLKTAQAHFSHARVALLTRDGRLEDEIQRLRKLKLSVAPLQHLYGRILEGFGDLYPWASLPSAPKPGHSIAVSEHVLAQFIKAFCAAGRLDAVERFWDDVSQIGLTPSTIIWSELIHGCGVLNGVNYAQTLWDSMVAEGIQPDFHTYRALISVYAREKRMREALALLKELEALLKKTPEPQDMPLEPLYNAVVLGLLNQRQGDNPRHHEDALALVERMKDCGPKPTIATYNTLMGHYNAIGDSKAVSRVLKMIAAEGLQGDSFTYSTLLCALLRVAGRDAAVKHVMSIMQRQGVQPDAVTYGAIISHLLKERTEDALFVAMDILKRMEEAGQPELAPKRPTYTHVLQAVYSWPQLPADVLEDCATYVLRQMRARQYRFDRVTYTVLIKACLWSRRPGGLQDGLRWFRDMQASSLQVPADVWYIVMAGLAKRKEWGLANTIAEEMLKTDALRNVRSEVRRWLLNVAQKVSQRQAFQEDGLEDLLGMDV